MFPNERTEPPAVEQRHAWPSVLLFGSLAGLVSALVWWRERSPEVSRATRGEIGIPGVVWDQAHNDSAVGAIAAVTALGLIAWGLARRGWLGDNPGWRRAADVVLITLTLSSGLCWAYGARGVAQPLYVKAWDQFHYYVGPKYFEELGYFDLYDCIAEADAQTLELLRNRRVRDLRSYGTIKVEHARKRTQCEQLFTPERWKALKADYVFYADLAGSSMRDIVLDHGYNGAPFNTFLGGKLANAFSLNYPSAVLASLLDPLAVFLALGVLGAAFGWRWAALVGVFLFTTFTDRGYFILGSFFRYHWLVTAALGLAALRKARHASAGAWFAAAAMLNVFPLVFFLGIGAKIGWTLVSKRALETAHKRFVLGALACSLALGALSVSHADHFANYRHFFEKMSPHSDLVTRSRVGFRFDLVYRGETRADEYSPELAAAELSRTKPVYIALALTLTLILLVLAGQLDDVEATVLCGFGTFFYAFSAVEYYYGIYALLLLFWYRRVDHPWAPLLLALPFAASALTAFVYQRTDALGLCNNTITSYAITLVLVAYQLAALGGEAASARLALARRVARGALVAAVGIIVGLTWLWLPPRALARVPGPTLAFGGDVNLGRRQHTFTTRNGVSHALAAIPELRSADLALANLECVVATSGERKVEKNETASYYFRARPEMLSILTQAGIDVVSTANNHSLDYGVSALREQRELLDAMRLAHFGSGDSRVDACAPVYRWVGDVAVAFFGIDATQASFGAVESRPGTCYYDLDARDAMVAELAPRFTEAKRRAHLVLVAAHWGPNRQARPSKAQVAFGHALVDAGADAVLGSSAHMVLGVDIYRDKPILHGAGDLLFDYPAKREEGALFSLVLSKDGVRQVWITPLARNAGAARKARGDAAARLLRSVRARSAALGTQLIVMGEVAGVELDVDPLPRAPVELPPSNPTLGPPPSPRAAPPDDCVVTEVPADARIDPVAIGPLKLLGARVQPASLAKKGPLWIETYWMADDVVTANYRISARALPVDAQRGDAWSADAEACDWQWPTDRWKPGVIYRDLLGVRPPDRIASGTLEIEVGLRADGGKRLPEHRIGAVELALER